nr:aldo/keto reductase [Saprospiraceae bacterium]
TRNGELQGKNDIYVQTKVALEIILEALEKAGANAKDVIRTRLFVSDISQWEKVGKAHGEVFGSILPATSMLQVAMIDPEIMVEIEATAIIA